MVGPKNVKKNGKPKKGKAVVWQVMGNVGKGDQS